MALEFLRVGCYDYALADVLASKGIDVERIISIQQITNLDHFMPQYKYLVWYRT